MSRKLILTPFEHGFFAGANAALNEPPLGDPNNRIDIAHIFLSAVTMAGVDSIHSIGKLQNSDSKLIKRIVSKASLEKWAECSLKVKSVFDHYKIESLDEEAKKELENLFYIILNLLFALKTNSAILLFSDLDKRKKELLPLDILAPTEVLFNSIQKKTAILPIVKYDIEKKDIQKLLDVLDSKEYHTYTEAQSEIESKTVLSSNTVKLIEKTGKNLYNKNLKFFYLKENIIKAVPMTSKVIDFFFGKLPGILAEYGTNILTDFLKLNKTLPIYSCDGIWDEIFKVRLIQKIKAANMELAAMANKQT